MDRPALRPLPRLPDRHLAIKPVKVNIDYHVQYEKHHYSVPHQYVGEDLALHAGDTLISLYFRGQAERPMRAHSALAPPPSPPTCRGAIASTSNGRRGG